MFVQGTFSWAFRDELNYRFMLSLLIGTTAYAGFCFVDNGDDGSEDRETVSPEVFVYGPGGARQQAARVE